VDDTAKAALDVDGAAYEMGALFVTVVYAPEGGALALTDELVAVTLFEHTQPAGCWLHGMACALAPCGNASVNHAPITALENPVHVWPIRTPCVISAPIR